MIELRVTLTDMALTAKGALNHPRTVKLALVVGVIALFVAPILAIPTMIVAGVRWKAAAMWARATFIVVAVAFAFVLVSTHHHHV